MTTNWLCCHLFQLFLLIWIFRRVWSLLLMLEDKFLITVVLQNNKVLSYFLLFFSVYFFAELQLKPTHIPFKLVCYWEELLQKYSSASEYERQRGMTRVLSSHYSKWKLKPNVVCCVVSSHSKLCEVYHQIPRMIGSCDIGVIWWSLTCTVPIVMFIYSSLSVPHWAFNACNVFIKILCILNKTYCIYSVKEFLIRIESFLPA